MFASKSPFTWDEEKTFKKLKQQLGEGRKLEDVVQGAEETQTENEKV